jgi:hypothetical protein
LNRQPFLLTLLYYGYFTVAPSQSNKGTWIANINQSFFSKKNYARFYVHKLFKEKILISIQKWSFFCSSEMRTTTKTKTRQEKYYCLKERKEKKSYCNFLSLVPFLISHKIRKAIKSKVISIESHRTHAIIIPS